jgi:DNA-binding SARP family transcriptional activator
VPGAEGSTPAEVRVLGPVEVWADGVAVPLPPLVRSLLAVLVADAGRVVSVDRLVDALWAGHPPADARNRLQAAVSALRRALNAPGLPSIVTTPPGYALRGNDGVDADRFATLLGRARTLAAERSTAEAIAAYGQALGLWRGSPFDGTDATGLDAASARLEEMQLAATEEWLQTRLDAGRYADAVAELTGLVAIHPLRERLRGLLMQALHRSGRTSDAVAAYRAWHSVACQELGLEPGAEIQHILRDILGGEASPAPASAEVPMLRPQQLPASVADFTGRDDDLRRLVSVLRRGGTIAVVTGMGGIGKPVPGF